MRQQSGRYDCIDEGVLRVADYRRKPREHIFIDDSGDAGLNKSTTDRLVIVAVIVADGNVADRLAEAVNRFRNRLGWHELDEFKFSRTNKKILMDLIDFIKDCDYGAYAVVLDKRKIDPHYTANEGISIYRYVLSELLLKVGKNDNDIRIDGKFGKKYVKEIRAHLRQSLREHGIMNVNIRFVDSRKEPLVQLADIFAGAIARSYKDRNDAQEFVKLIEKKIVKIDDIGLK